MKTYLELLKTDYNYLNDIRYIIGTSKDEQQIPFNPKLLSTIEDYYFDEFEYYTTIINLLTGFYLGYIKKDENINNKYILEAVKEYKKKLTDCIDRCMRALVDTKNEEENHG